jgi:hypothetical protein
MPVVLSFVAEAFVMDLSKIISVAGKPGLFRIVAQGRQALIVESLIDGKRMPIHSSVKVSSLEEISMFTTGDDVPLSKVLESLYKVEQGGASLDPKEDADKLFAKLGEALPEHDRERIYPSDVRKLFTWYALLLKSGEFEAKEEPKEEVAPEVEKATKEGKKAPAKKAPAKVAKTAAKASTPKPAVGSKPKATTMRKSAQRGA